MKIELVKSVYTYSIKIPKLSYNQMQCVYDILKVSPVDEKTCVGDDDGYMIVESSLTILETLKIVEEAIRVAKIKIWQYTPCVPMSEIPIGGKFVLSGDNEVYTKESIGQKFELKDCTFHKNTAKGAYSCFLMLNDYHLVHPIDTTELFVNVKKL